VHRTEFLGGLRGKAWPQGKGARKMLTISKRKTNRNGQKRSSEQTQGDVVSEPFQETKRRKGRWEGWEVKEKKRTENL